jgi:hypothetical protein
MARAVHKYWKFSDALPDGHDFKVSLVLRSARNSNDHPAI